MMSRVSLCIFVFLVCFFNESLFHNDTAGTVINFQDRLLLICPSGMMPSQGCFINSSYILTYKLCKYLISLTYHTVMGPWWLHDYKKKVRKFNWLSCILLPWKPDPSNGKVWWLVHHGWVTIKFWGNIHVPRLWWSLKIPLNATKRLTLGLWLQLDWLTNITTSNLHYREVIFSLTDFKCKTINLKRHILI